MNRREFLRRSAGGLALALLPQTLSFGYQESRPSLRVAYLPDRHVPDYQQGVIGFVNRNLKDFDAVCLEGLEGDIDQKYIEEIKKADSHRTHLEEKRKNLTENFKRKENLSRVEKELICMLSMSTAWDFLKTDCCRGGSDYLRYSPGAAYAPDLFAKKPLFGMEDLRLYKEAVEKFE